MYKSFMSGYIEYLNKNINKINEFLKKSSNNDITINIF